MRFGSILMGAAAALVLGTSGAIGATLITLNGGALGAISRGNDLLEPLGLGPSLTGYFGAAVSGNAGAYRYEFLGFEAGAQNRFTMGSPALTFSTEEFTSNLKVWTPLKAVTTGSLDFAFLTSLSSFIVEGKKSAESVGLPNAFASFGDGRKTGDALYIFFDDSGAGIDSDYDDLAVRITALTTIPLPAPIALLLGSLVGLALLSRHRAKLD